jgi:pimeloyl-ACP methyl ester carboxylesterase
MPTLSADALCQVAQVNTAGSPIIRHRGRTFDPTLPAVINCHGWGENHGTYLADWRLNALLRTGWTVYTPYTGFNWGTNDPVPDDSTGRQAIADTVTRAATDGHSAPVMLYGTSMGACNAMNHAWRNPADVAAIYMLTPVYDIPSVHGSDVLLTASLEATFGVSGLANVTTASADYDPARNTAGLAGIPMAAHAVEDDVIVDYAGLVTFCAGLDITLTSSPTGGHAGAWSGTYDEYDALRWFTDHA